MHGNQVTRGQRLIATDHHQVGQVTVKNILLLAALGCRAGEDATQHPTGSVDAHHPSQQVLALDLDRQGQLLAKDAVHLLAGGVGL